jgi:hypothetical protein
VGGIIISSFGVFLSQRASSQRRDNMGLDMLRRSYSVFSDGMGAQAVFLQKKHIGAESGYNICSWHFLFLPSDFDIFNVYGKYGAFDIFDRNAAYPV